MRVPGSNLLKIAHRLIGFQRVMYFKFIGRTLNASRQWMPEFDAGTQLEASVQAIDRSTYAAMGLDFNSFYVKIWASLNMIDLDRDSSGDQFEYNGDRYKMSHGQVWFEQDGWATCMANRISPALNVVTPHEGQ